MQIMDVDNKAPNGQQQAEAGSTKKRGNAAPADAPPASGKRQRTAAAAPANAVPSPLRICLSSSSSESGNDQEMAAGQVDSNQVGAQPTSQVANAADSDAAEQSTSQVYQVSSSQPQGGSQAAGAEHAPSARSQKPADQGAGAADAPCGSYSVSELSAAMEDARAALEQELLLPLSAVHGAHSAWVSTCHTGTHGDMHTHMHMHTLAVTPTHANMCKHNPHTGAGTRANTSTCYTVPCPEAQTPQVCQSVFVAQVHT